jgi:hypothetical protein
MNKIIETTGITEFQKIFQTHRLTDYEYIYISFGSKYYLPKNTKKISNAKWKMIPGFIYNKKNILVLCIDRFENNKIKKINKNIIKQHILSDRNINIIICDIDRTIQLFEILIINIIKRLTKYSINKEKVIIVNYFRFTTPNHIEKYLEQNLSLCFQKILVKTVYSNCFYEWFGYTPNLYNIIYRYNIRIIYNILPIIYCNNEFSIENNQLIDLFLKNIYDITMIHTMKSFSIR